MKTLFVFAAALLLAVSVSSMRVARQPGPPKPPGQKEQDCTDCNDQLEQSIAMMKDSMPNPFEMEMKDGPCKKCDVTKLETIGRSRDVCPNNMGPGKYQQELRLNFTVILIRCDCVMKNQKGEDCPATLNAKWSRPHIRAILDINAADTDTPNCQVLRGEVDCDNPQPKCVISKDDIDVKCETDDDHAKQSCEDKTLTLGICQNVAEGCVPGVATEQANKNPQLMKLIYCKEDSSSSEE